MLTNSFKKQAIASVHYNIKSGKCQIYQLFENTADLSTFRFNFQKPLIKITNHAIFRNFQYFIKNCVPNLNLLFWLLFLITKI